MTDEIPIQWLFATLAVMLACSGFFSMSETCMMALNRYRLRHLVREGSRGARMAQALLAHTDELLAFILAGNTVINAATTILVAEIARRLLGEGEFTLAIATGAASFAILIFAEILPKIFGARFSEPVALASSYILTPLLRVTKPLMYLINLLVKGILMVLRISPVGEEAQPLSMGELRTLVLEGGKFIPKKHQSIFLNLFELEDMTVDDTMTPRTHIESIDIEDDIDEINTRVSTSHHTRLVVYEGSLDKVVGILHVRKYLNTTRKGALTKEELRGILREPYFVPEGTKLLDQLQNFQDRLRHVALVVDEYGEMMGLVTLEDILEEIVGDITDEHDVVVPGVRPQPDGSVNVDGGVPIRDLNRAMEWNLPDDEATTVAGLVIHEARSIPEPGQTFTFHGFRFRVLRRERNRITALRITPLVRKPVPAMKPG